jgi:allantoinase
VAEWMSAAPARLAGVPNKGSIAIGMDADVIIFDPDAELTVKGASLHHRHALTPYEGERLHGIVRSTYLRGEQVYDVSRGHGAPRGRVIERAVASAE